MPGQGADWRGVGCVGAGAGGARRGAATRGDAKAVWAAARGLSGDSIHARGLRDRIARRGGAGIAGGNPRNPGRAPLARVIDRETLRVRSRLADLQPRPADSRRFRPQPPPPPRTFIRRSTPSPRPAGTPPTRTRSAQLFASPNSP